MCNNRIISLINKHRGSWVTQNGKEHIWKICIHMNSNLAYILPFLFLPENAIQIHKRHTVLKKQQNIDVGLITVTRPGLA